MIDPELQSQKPQRRPAAAQKSRAEIKIWVTQPKLDLLESAIGQLVEREPKWYQAALALAKEARLVRLQKVLESFDKTASERQEEMLYGE